MAGHIWSKSGPETPRYLPRPESEMGRYTTVQTYTDKDAKVAAIAYSTAVSDASAPSPSAAAALAGAATEVASGGDASKRDGDEKSTAADDRFSTARVDNVSGSSAGAGSGDFHMYRAARRRLLCVFRF
jgi:hypothetical protein